MWWTPILALLSKIPTTAFSLFTGINVNSVFSGVGKVFNALFTSIRTHWQLWLVGVLLAGNAFTFGEWRHTETLLTKERAAHAADIANFKQAQAMADSKAQAERAALQKESKANADQADADYSGLLVQYRASLLRYSHNQGAASKPSHSKLPPAQGSNGPSTDTNIPNAVLSLPPTITITGSDAEICAVNTARLVSVRDWAIKQEEQDTP